MECFKYSNGILQTPEGILLKELFFPNPNQ